MTQKKILAIDDDVAFQKIYKDMFPADEFTVTEALTGQEDLTLVERDTPDIILLDIMLPGGKNGFDVLEDLKAKPTTKNIPVIVLTNLDSEEKVAKTIGATEYLIKAQTTAADIVQKVRNRLQHSLN